MGLSHAARRFLMVAPPKAKERFLIEDVVERRARNLRSYEAGSRLAIERHQVEIQDVEYGGIRCLQVVRRDRISDLTVFYCFGGGLITGSPFESLPIACAISEFAQATVICPYYRLAPEWPFPHGLNDVVTAYEALRRSKAREVLAVAGESAGGNLVLSMLQRLEKQELPDAAVLLSPWCDLSLSGDSVVSNAGRDPTLSPEYLLAAATCYAVGRHVTDPAVSPLFGNYRRPFPPTMITTGTRDLILSDSVRLSHVLQTSGIEVELRINDDLWHVFEFYGEIPEARRSLEELAVFLRFHCRCKPLPC